jgi:hypothetical protein
MQDKGGNDDLSEIISKFGFTVYAPPADGQVKVKRGYLGSAQ